MYFCTCESSSDSFELFCSLGTNISCSYAKFSEDFPYCIHVNAVTQLIVEIDATHHITPDLDFEGIQII